MDSVAHKIIIRGVVQGVGFRPTVYQLARSSGMNGWIVNNNEGVMIHCEASDAETRSFLQLITGNLPPLARVSEVQIEQAEPEGLADFRIRQSDISGPVRVLLTPDVATCPDCLRELHTASDRRFVYPFITCTNCGPRYSIIQKLPYDRPHTTMDDFPMCQECEQEYRDPSNRRYHSQTNSCPDCRIRMSLVSQAGVTEDFTRLNKICELWDAGRIVAIKGIGGYLLTCSATDDNAVKRLRSRKARPDKPLAVMFPDLDMIRRLCRVSPEEESLLQEKHAPIVLLNLKPAAAEYLAVDELTRGLDKIGAMLPYTPLYHLLLREHGKPIVATSGNLSNSTIIYRDDDAQRDLAGLADFILMNDRLILIPQDDGVEQIARNSGRQIVLRRSRGKAPILLLPDRRSLTPNMLATGALLKSTFGFTHQGNTYLSQYLGNSLHFEAQQNYEACFNHLRKTLSLKVEQVITDLHPEFFSTQFGKRLAEENDCPVLELQHHKAHFYAVLGEHGLQESTEPILGIIWDGLGLGEDGQVWGGEHFLFEKGKMSRVAHLEYFPVLAGDKMALEPRISALALAWSTETARGHLREKFSEQELRLYLQIREHKDLLTSSMGRFVDAFASLILGQDYNTYEAKAAMHLEQAAARAYYSGEADQVSYLEQETGDLTGAILTGVLEDLDQQIDKEVIALRFHRSLVSYIKELAIEKEVKTLAFSGGVFQNSLLVDLITEMLDSDFQLLFHQELSPNDECIPFGQLVWADGRNLGIFE